MFTRTYLGKIYKRTMKSGRFHLLLKRNNMVYSLVI